MTSSRCVLVLLVTAILALAGPVRAAEPPVLLGIYPNGSFFDASGPQELQQINAWIGDPSRHVSLGGTFMDVEWPGASATVPAELDGVWSSGAVPFVNLTVGTVTAGRTARDVANGLIDARIRQWADAFKSWATGGRRAFIAFLQEMNSDWVSYGGDPENFKLAFTRIRDIFGQQGVPPDSVRWVFAPNGWSAPGYEFERYYPGNRLVDVVGFSAFNFGTCVWAWPEWSTYPRLFKPFLDRMRVMAPSKPLFIAQTASVDWGGDKNAWLDDSLSQLAAYPGVRAILYFHKRVPGGLPCDPVEWRFFAPSTGVDFPGLRNALLRAANGYGHWAPTAAEWTTIAFAPGPGGNTFEDVEPAHPFAGVDTVWYFDAVESVAAAGVAAGCSTVPKNFCPAGVVTRAQMAAFLLKGKHGAGFTPGAPRGVFADVPPSHWAAAWIEQLATEGITGGCGAGNYCPDAPVTRAQMAAFLLKAKYGAAFVPPSPTGVFADVPPNYWAAAWIEQLAIEGITGGCGGGAYCPESSVTRGEMAVFLKKTFNLP